jgi:hypothetical protein
MAIKVMSLFGMTGNIKLPRLSRAPSPALAGEGLGGGVSAQIVDDPAQFVPSES